MRKIEDDVLDNGGSSSDNTTPTTPAPQSKKDTKNKVFIAFGIIIIVAVAVKLLGF